MRLLLAISVVLISHQLYAGIFDSAAVLGDGYVAMYETRIVESPNSPFTVVLDGGTAGNVTIEGNNTFEIRSGTFTDLDAHDQAIVILYGGSTFGDGVRAYDNSTITIFDGSFPEDVTSYGGTVNVHGGVLGNGAIIQMGGTLNIFGTELVATFDHYDDADLDTTYRVKGKFADGINFAFGVTVNENSSMILHTVPEPSTALLILLGLPLTWRRGIQ